MNNDYKVWSGVVDNSKIYIYIYFLLLKVEKSIISQLKMTFISSDHTECVHGLCFQGLWSKETHPRDFPTSEWLLHFSDLIGASHDFNYRSIFHLYNLFIS